MRLKMNAPHMPRPGRRKHDSEAGERGPAKKKRSRLSNAGVYHKISAVLPKRVIAAYARILVYAGRDKVDVRDYLSSKILGSIVLFFTLLIAVPLFFRLETLYVLAIAIAAPVVWMLWSYVGPMLAADRKAQQIEMVLPDALQLISSNIRAGMTIDKALWLCAKPEFGPLEKELRKMAAETLGGKTLTKSLEAAAARVKSDIMGRAMLLLVQGVQLGGELAHLLIEISADIRTKQALQREINAATSMYTIFIIFASVLAAPALFAVSTFYVQSTAALWSGKTSESTSQLEELGGVQMFKMSGGGITSDEVRIFAVVCISATTFFGGLTIGTIKYGRAKRGIKYVAPFMMGGLGMYFVVYAIVLSMFGMILT